MAPSFQVGLVLTLSLIAPLLKVGLVLGLLVIGRRFSGTIKRLVRFVLLPDLFIWQKVEETEEMRAESESFLDDVGTATRQYIDAIVFRGRLGLVSVFVERNVGLALFAITCIAAAYCGGYESGLNRAAGGTGLSSFFWFGTCWLATALLYPSLGILAILANRFGDAAGDPLNGAHAVWYLTTGFQIVCALWLFQLVNPGPTREPWLNQVSIKCVCIMGALTLIGFVGAITDTLLVVFVPGYISAASFDGVWAVWVVTDTLGALFGAMVIIPLHRRLLGQWTPVEA